MNPLWIAAIAVLVLVVVVEIVRPGKSEPKEGGGRVYNYRRKDFLITRAEHEFFDILVDVVGSQYYVFPQIHLTTMLDNKIVGQSWRGAFRHIDEKSVDYVICDKAYIKPLLAIELDDHSHEREDRKERDGEVERILREAGMPLLRVPNHGHFDREEIRRQIFENLGAKPESPH